MKTKIIGLVFALLLLAFVAAPVLADSNVDVKYYPIDMTIPLSMENMAEMSNSESGEIYIDDLELMQMPIGNPDNSELYGYAWMSLDGYINLDCGKIYLCSNYAVFEFYHPMFAEMNSVNDCNGFWSQPGGLELYANDAEMQGSMMLFGYGAFDYSCMNLNVSLENGMLHLQGYMQMPAEQGQMWEAIA